MSHEDTKDTKQRSFLKPSESAERAAHAVIGSAIAVHRSLGPGFVELIYERALAIELEHRRIPFERQVPVLVSYRGIVVGEHRLDFLIDEEVVVELKSLESLSSNHRSQVISYLRGSSLTLGLLINFNVPVLHQGIKRVLWSPT